MEQDAAPQAVFMPVRPPSASWQSSCGSPARPCARRSPRWSRAATWSRCAGASGTFVAAEPARAPRLDGLDELVAAMTDVQEEMTDLIALIPHPPEVLARANEQHAKIVKALRRGDGPRAVRLIRSPA